MALAVWTEPALARSYLNCLTKKVVIVDHPRESASRASKKTWVLDRMKRQRPSCLAEWSAAYSPPVLMIAGLALRGDMSYELIVQNGSFDHASSTTKEGSATIIIRGQADAKLQPVPQNKDRNRKGALARTLPPTLLAPRRESSNGMYPHSIELGRARGNVAT